METKFYKEMDLASLFPEKAILKYRAIVINKF